jgi:hypothetical protein
MTLPAVRMKRRKLKMLSHNHYLDERWIAMRRQDAEHTARTRRMLLHAGALKSSRVVRPAYWLAGRTGSMLVAAGQRLQSVDRQEPAFAGGVCTEC